MTRGGRAALLAVALAATMAPVGVAAQKAPFPGRTQTAPISGGSVFEPALRCMDELLARSRVGKGFPFVATSIDDPTGKLGFTRDMIVDAARTVSEHSRFLQIYFAKPPGDQTSVYFRPAGSITAFDPAVESQGGGAGLTIGSVAGVSARNRSTTGTLTLSLSFVDPAGRLVDGTFSSAQVILRSKERTRLLSGALSVFGGSLSLDSASTDSPVIAVKALIDLAMIQAVGALAQVPYASCLARTATAPAESADAFRTWTRMKPAARNAAIDGELSRRGLLSPGATTAQRYQAIAAFQRSQAMPVTGAPDFAVYQALRGANAPADPLNRPARGAPSVKVSPASGGFRYAPGGSIPKVVAGDRLAFEVTVAEPGYVACYYTDDQHVVRRVFPTAQRPAYRLTPGESLRIPGDQDSFAIVPRVRAVREWFTCFAAPDQFLPRLAPRVADTALLPLSGIAGASQLVKTVAEGDSSIRSDTLTYDVE